MTPKHMRVARFYDLDDIRLEEQPVPDIGPGEALVKMAICGICTSDTLPWYVRRKAPAVLGHEPVGSLAAIGPNVEDFRTGDRVFVHHHAPCMTCRLCRRGLFSMCPTWKASSLDPGGLAEYVRVPALNLSTDTLRLPEELPFEDAALIEPTACAVQALKRRAQVRPGDRVLIIGMGIMGQLLSLVARHYGAGSVIVADRVRYRLDQGLELGADVAVDVTREDLNGAVSQATGGELADLVVVGPGSLEAMASGFSCVGVGGTVQLFTPAQPEELLQVDPYDLYARDLTITASYSCGPPDTREALDLVLNGVVSARQLVTHRFPLSKTAEAFATVAAAGESMKTLVILDEDACGQAA